MDDSNIRDVVKVYRDGSKYEGGWKDGMKHGYGVMSYTTGHVYKGNYINGVVNGQGFVTFRNGDTYKGNYKDNKKHGNGVYTWRNGDKYEGNWLLNLSNGSGIMTYSNGTIEKGENNPKGLHFIFPLELNGISALSKKVGLFKVINKSGEINYKYYNDNGVIDNEKTKNYNMSNKYMPMELKPVE